MSPENVHDRKENRHFTIVLVPGGESTKTRTFSISRWGFFLGGFALFGVTVAGIFSLIAYTPVRSLLPVSNPELERRYGRQILQIQEEVSRLVEEMNVLRSYNLRLRSALGESMTTEDSTLIASHPVKIEPNTSALNSLKLEEPPSATSSVSAMKESPQHLTGIQERVEKIQAVDVPARVPRLQVDFPMSKPAEGYVTQGFDVSRYHYGIDFAGKKSTAVLATADGNVIFSGWTYDDGYMIMIAHGLGFVSVYKHNESLLKITGAAVRRGEPIALLGNTGRTSSGPHLHFEIWKDGIAYDPGQFLLTTQ